jgi:serine/threonine protein kinase
MALIKSKGIIHRDLKLANVLIHFKKLPVDVWGEKVKGN